jgi:hypothetical protein
MTGGKVHVEEVMNKLKNKDEELREVVRKMEDYESQFINKERIFKESKSYMEEILK